MCGGISNGLGQDIVGTCRRRLALRRDVFRRLRMTATMFNFCLISAMTCIGAEHRGPETRHVVFHPSMPSPGFGDGRAVECDAFTTKQWGLSFGIPPGIPLMKRGGWLLAFAHGQEWCSAQVGPSVFSSRISV